MFNYYSVKYVRDDRVTANDRLKDDDDGTVNKDGEGDNGYKSKDDIVNDDSVNKDSKEDDDKDKGAEVHKKGSMSQHRWEVWRRYSEFELLKNFLQTVYPHVSLFVTALLECLYLLVVGNISENVVYLVVCY